METDIFEVIEFALAKAGYEIMDSDVKSIIVRHANSDSDYRITVEREPC
jgi:hypothetical protein